MSMRHRIVRTGVAAALAVGAIPVCTANAAAAPADPPKVWVAEGATGDGQSSTAPMSPAAVNALSICCECAIACLRSPYLLRIRNR